MILIKIETIQVLSPVTDMFGDVPNQYSNTMLSTLCLGFCLLK